MFRQAISAILILMFVVQTFSKPFIMLDYYANTAAFAKHCINKQRPKMHCNGKCQAMMKIAAQEKKQQQQEENKLNGKSEVISSKTFFATALQIYFEHISISYVTFDDDTEMNMPRSLFHPPTA